MGLLHRVLAALAVLPLAACAPGVVVTEVVTVTEVAPPAEALYREVPAEPFIGRRGHTFASSDGVTECEVFPARAGMDTVLDPRAGECVSWSPGSENESLIIFSQHGDDSFSSDASPSLPRRRGHDHHTLHPGELVRFGPLTCFSARPDALACVDVYRGEGFELADEAYREFHWDDAVDLLEHPDGTREIIGELVRLDFDNGGHIFCDRNGDYFNCGGATGLNFPPGSNSVSFYRGAEDGHGTGDMGEFQSQAQGAGRGVFFFAGLTFENTGTRATFTTPQGGTFWVGVDGFGVD